MNRFRLAEGPIDPADLARALDDPAAGARACFEGRVRDHHQGRGVMRLSYQAYPQLAEREGEAIMIQALERFDILHAMCVHRVGELAIGDLAVWVGVSSAHREAAFEACRWIIDAIKERVPIWKHEHYADGESVWLHPSK